MRSMLDFCRVYAKTSLERTRRPIVIGVDLFILAKVKGQSSMKIVDESCFGRHQGRHV